MDLDAVPGHHPLQLVGELLDPEHARGGQHHHHPGTGQGALVAPVVRRQVGDLLGRPGALDRPRRHGEQGRTPAGGLDVRPGPGGRGQQVVRGHRRAVHRRLHPRDGAEVELDARAHHQVVVADDSSRGQSHRLLVRVDTLGVGLDPVHGLGHHAGLRAPGLLRRRLTGADQRPQRLVVVGLRGLDHADVGLARAEQASRDGDAGRPAADDQDLVVRTSAHGVGPIRNWIVWALAFGS